MKLSVVIPAYNEQGSITETLCSLHNILVKHKIAHEILVVNDNSKDNTLSISCFFVVAAAFTSGNGMFTFLAGSMMLLYQKQYKKIMIWGILMGISIMLYFYNYQKPAHHPEISEAILDPVRTIQYMLLFLSSELGKGFYIIPILTYGIIAHIFFSGTYKRDLFLSSLIIFLLLTAGAASITRSGFGAEQALSGRYAINSSLLIIIFFLFYLNQFDGKPNKISVLLLLLALFINIRGYSISRTGVINIHNKLLDANCTHLFHKVYPEHESAFRIITKSASLGIYEMPDKEEACKD